MQRISLAENDRRQWQTEVERGDLDLSRWWRRVFQDPGGESLLSRRGEHFLQWSRLEQRLLLGSS